MENFLFGGVMAEKTQRFFDSMDRKAIAYYLKEGKWPERATQKSIDRLTKKMNSPAFQAQMKIEEAKRKLK